MKFFKEPLKLQFLNIFSKDECNFILTEFHKNKDKIKLSTDHGVERISSYELDGRFFSKESKDLINKKIREKITPITGGKPGMIFGVRYSIDTKSYMTEHYDCNSYSCVITLNDDFEDGGTYFPFSGNLIQPPIGWGCLFRADKLNSYHSAHPISKGVRYVLVIRMEKMNSLFVIGKALFLHFVDKYIRKNKEKLYLEPKLVYFQ